MSEFLTTTMTVLQVCSPVAVHEITCGQGCLATDTPSLFSYNSTTLQTRLLSFWIYQLCCTCVCSAVFQPNLRFLSVQPRAVRLSILPNTNQSSWYRSVSKALMQTTLMPTVGFYSVERGKCQTKWTAANEGERSWFFSETTHHSRVMGFLEIVPSVIRSHCSCTLGIRTRGS